jgi:hypothetical protein
MSAIEPQWQFPNERERIRDEAERFRGLSSSERFERILELLAVGESLLAASPHRDAGRRLKERDEQEWRRRMGELFSQHAAGTLKTAGPHQDGAA